MRILGIDYGAKKIGLAIGDTETRLASPLSIMKNDERFLGLLQNLVKDEEIKKLVVGIPGGREYENNEQREINQQFALSLQDIFTIPIVEFDENYTTAEAIKLMSEAGTSQGDDDAVAAMVMLQAFLDTNANL